MLTTAVHWIGGAAAGPLWDAAANWSNDAVPTSADDVTIDSGTSTTITIQSGDTESVNSLTTAAGYALSITGGSLAIADNSTLVGNLNLSGGALSVAAGASLIVGGASNSWTGGTLAGAYAGSGGGTVTLSLGQLNIGAGGATFDFPSTMFQWTGGTINTNGNTLTNTGVMTLADASGVVLTGNGLLVNQGTIDDAGAGSLLIGQYGGNGVNPVLDNQSGATFAFQSDSGISSYNTWGSFSNEGTLSKTGGTATSTIQNTSFSNSGIINVATGELALAASSGTSTGGAFNVAQGASLDLTGGASVNYAGSYTGSGAGTVALSLRPDQHRRQRRHVRLPRGPVPVDRRHDQHQQQHADQQRRDDPREFDERCGAYWQRLAGESRDDR